MSSSWAWGSKRSNGRNVPLVKPGEKKKVKCPKCGEEATVYYDEKRAEPVISSHKVYEKKNGKKTTKYAICKG